ncbi:unnamed protein product [Leptidea sinapis]|uniref:Golgin-84 n=1 Tax=Leptidea sinapis TaxID=189913 RepID=A0A5E4QBM7_9NEOP|nr:unnamed protein product [Leptidea sinapis]
MSWFAGLAGKAENLLNNLDEQTGAVLRNHGNAKPNNGLSYQSSITIPQKKRQPPRNTQSPFDTRSSTPIRKSSPPIKRSPSPKRGVTDKKNIMKTNQEQNNRSPNRKTTKYNLNNSPPTLVNECNDGLRHRKKDGLILQLNELKAEIEGEDLNEKSAKQMKLEKDLKHTQSRITELESELEKSKSECGRLEKEWESYKHRVKNMLNAKDGEIKALRDGGRTGQSFRSHNKY